MLDTAHPGYAKVNEGQPYVGKAKLFGKDYMTKYIPVKDGAGKVIGILFIGLDFTEGLKASGKRSVARGRHHRLSLRPRRRQQGHLMVHPAIEGKNRSTPRRQRPRNSSAKSSRKGTSMRNVR
jgi:hypothetical protein